MAKQRLANVAECIVYFWLLRNMVCQVDASVSLLEVRLDYRPPFLDTNVFDCGPNSAHHVFRKKVVITRPNKRWSEQGGLAFARKLKDALKYS